MQGNNDGHRALWHHKDKLAVLAERAVDLGERKWVMDAPEGLQTNGLYSSNGISKSLSQNDKTHAGIMAMLIFTFKVLRRCSGFTIAAVGLHPEDMTARKERAKGHKEYFAAAGPHLRQSWLRSTVAALRLLEAQSLERPCQFACNQVSFTLALVLIGTPHTLRVVWGKRLSSKKPSVLS